MSTLSFPHIILITLIAFPSVSIAEEGVNEVRFCIFAPDSDDGKNGELVNEQVKPEIDSLEGMIQLVPAPEKPFKGVLFFLNDWDGGDPDNQNAGEELNHNSPIKEGVIILSDLPNRKPKKVQVNDLVTEAKILADASQRGPVAIALGAHSRHALGWLTALPREHYRYDNITLVTHSNWNELDGRAGYDANKKPGDPPLEDTHGENLRRGLYPNLAKISDLGVTILEIPRTDSGPGGWGGAIQRADGGKATVKALDISDLGLIHYLKTGIIQANRQQRNEYVSDLFNKPETLEKVKRSLITRHWKGNHEIPGYREDYLPGGKFSEIKN